MNLPDRCAVVPRSLTTTVSPKQPLLCAVFDAGTTAGLVAVCTSNTCQITVKTFMSTVVARHGIHYSADGVAAIKECGWSFNHFDFLNGQHIDRLGMIARLKTQTAYSISVLQHEDPIPVKATDDRPGSAGTETSF